MLYILRPAPYVYLSLHIMQVSIYIWDSLSFYTTPLFHPILAYSVNKLMHNNRKNVHWNSYSRHMPSFSFFISHPINVSHQVQGVHRKNCVFFTIHCNPSLAYVAIRDLQSSQRKECTVTPIGLQFFVQPIAAECWRGRGDKLSRILGIKHNI